jgi:hypothetical protein
MKITDLIILSSFFKDNNENINKILNSIIIYRLHQHILELVSVSATRTTVIRDVLGTQLLGRVERVFRQNAAALRRGNAGSYTSRAR